MDDKLENAFNWIVSLLQKHKIPFQLSGGFAAHIYGAARPVNDIDLDVPEDRMDELLAGVRRYVVFGPGRDRDEKWDLKLVTLKYRGQEIDIGGAFETKIFDEKNSRRVICPARLETARKRIVFGTEVPVVAPEDLIGYKKLLNGAHQREDVEAVKRHLAKGSPP